jgi:hypothetical protein
VSETQRQKLYCYVDETGQDTKGAMFLVVVVITAEDPDALRAALERIEKVSAKGARKWFKTNRERRVAYIREIVQSGLFTCRIRARLSGRRSRVTAASGAGVTSEDH